MSHLHHPYHVANLITPERAAALCGQTIRPDSVDALLQPRQVVVIDLMNYVGLIESMFNAFIPPEPGIYIPSNIEPVLRPNQPFFSESSYLQQIPLASLDNVYENILDQNGAVVIPRYVMCKQRQLLRNAPTLPAQPIRAVYGLCGDFINQHLKYSVGNHYEIYVSRLLRDDYQYLHKEGYLERALTPLMQEIARFMGEDDWCIYNLTLRNTSVVIEKASDYRIVEWTLQQESSSASRFAN